MTPASAKSKGRRLQQHVRDLLLELFPELEPDDVKSTGMGQQGEDIMLSPAARRFIPFQIECKNKAASQVHTYYSQAKEHGTHEPLVVVKKDRDIPLAVLSLESFLKLLREINANRG